MDNAGSGVLDSKATGSLSEEQKQATINKALKKLIPFIFVCYVVSYLDRINVGFAALTMNEDIGLTPLTFGWGAGLFFFGYFIFEIPSNLLMQKFGARIWLARIMITWGIVSIATAFVVGPKSFAVARFFLGVAEAGFTPGVFLYFTSWFPGKARARATAAFFLGIPVANIIGAPVSGFLLQLNGFMGLKGWQVLLVVEALPAVLLGIACLYVLADKPEKAGWLSPEEKLWLESELALEKNNIAEKHGNTLKDAFTNWRVFVLAAVNFCCIVGSVGIGMWMPQIIKEFGLSYSKVGLLTALPYAIGAFAMIVWARKANASKNRMRYVLCAIWSASIFVLVSSMIDMPVYKMMALCIAVASILCFQATFWAIPSTFLTGRAAAGGLALIVSIGNLGGFFGPSVIGYIRNITQKFSYSLVFVSLVLVLGAMLMLLISKTQEQGADL